MTGVLLVGHGSRNRDSVACLHDIARALEHEHGWPIVEVAFLELCPPDIQQGFDTCVARGARRVVLVPYFLFPGGHVQQDLPAQVEQARQRHPGLEAVLGDVLGFDSILVQLVQRRIVESVARLGWEPVADEPSHQPAAGESARIRGK